MMMPSIFGDNLFEDWMSFPFGRDVFGDRSPRHESTQFPVMKTDIKETDGSFELDIDLPGFQKEDVQARLDDGYLTISATQSKNNDEKDENGKYIRRERYTGSMKRSFYVGNSVTQEDIKAKFENGILKLSVPKKNAAIPEQNKYIAIEG